VPGDDPAVGLEDLFENAPCGYVATDGRGRIVRANRRVTQLTGLTHDALTDGLHLQDLLTPGGRVYHETHLVPLLRLRGSIDEVALELVRRDGTRLPVLVNASALADADAGLAAIRYVIFAARDRRRYEQELLNAQRHEHAVAQELQRSLLAGALPSRPGLELAVAYESSEAGLDVGGDWYDAFWRDDRERILAMVVGDVVGRGVRAAATMGQLRSATRALAQTGIGPARVLTELERFARRHGVGQMTTLVHAELDLETRALTYACAGHPPPLLLRPGAASAFLWDGRSTPLDARLTGDDRRREARLTLEPGAAVLLYTDGLVERRRRPADDGSQRLSSLARDAIESSVADAVRLLTTTLRDPDDPDDVCLLMARLR
jgi:sigma-B regulation protein RsbU (phosphoserine phosphatase)